MQEESREDDWRSHGPGIVAEGVPQAPGGLQLVGRPGPLRAGRDSTQDACPAAYNRAAFWYDPGSIASITLQDRPGRAGTYSR